MTHHIYIYSPSSAVRDKLSFKRGVKRLQALGYEVEVDSAALSKYQRFAGDDAARLAAIYRAAASGADMAMISRGGYGLTRILPDIPYKAVAKAIESGTQFIGLSDFTALQMALLAKTGASTWAGPTVGADFGCEEAPDEIMQACFEDLVTGRGEGAGWRLPSSQGAIDSIAVAAGNKRAEGPFGLENLTLWGGNLAILAGLVGTPYLPQIKRGALFIEDVGEHPYRLERLLTQLLHSGVLAGQKAIILGQFDGYKLVPGYDSGFNLTSVALWLQARVKAKVLMGLPFGHCPTKVCLPVGAKVNLVVEGRDALLLWGNPAEHH